VELVSPGRCGGGGELHPRGRPREALHGGEPARRSERTRPRRGWRPTPRPGRDEDLAPAPQRAAAEAVGASLRAESLDARRGVVPSMWGAAGPSGRQRRPTASRGSRRPERARVRDESPGWPVVGGARDLGSREAPRARRGVRRRGRERRPVVGGEAVREEGPIPDLPGGAPARSSPVGAVGGSGPEGGPTGRPRPRPGRTIGGGLEGLVVRERPRSGGVGVWWWRRAGGGRWVQCGSRAGGAVEGPRRA